MVVVHSRVAKSLSQVNPRGVHVRIDLGEGQALGRY
jgi:hypothetical protein